MWKHGTYLASSAKAKTPAASGAAAEVPEWRSVQFPYRSVVAWRKEMTEETENEHLLQFCLYRNDYVEAKHHAQPLCADSFPSRDPPNVASTPALRQPC